MFGNQSKAVELCVNRFDTATKLAFIDLYDKVAGGELEEKDTDTDELDGVLF